MLSISNALLQLMPDALIILEVEDERRKSLPSVARLLHRIFLLSFIDIVLPSHDGFDDDIEEAVVSVILAVPPPNARE